MALGPTHYRWRPDVDSVVDRIEARFRGVRCNTYVGHPFPRDGDPDTWDPEHVSVDVWGPGGRGDPISRYKGRRVLRYIRHMAGRPAIRHWIFLHTLWTSWGGRTFWTAADHSGDLRHIHVTFY